MITRRPIGRDARRHTFSAANASLLLLAIGGSLPGSLQAQPNDEDPEPVGEPFRIGGPEIEVELGLRAQGSRNQDAPGELQRDIDRLRAGIRLDLRQQLTARSSARADLQFRAERASDDVLDSDEESEFRLRRLYLQYEDEAERLQARLGRQGLEDAMSWYIDEDVDGIRLGYAFSRATLDVSVSRDADEDRDDDPTNALAVLQFDFDNKTSWTPWLLYRTTRDDVEHIDQTWAGLQGIGRQGKRLRYWLNAAVRDGERRRASSTRQLGGTAVDVGAVWILPLAFEPSFTVGYARASGDAQPGTDDDTFRQSGLHSNEYRFNGENDFRYLGEVLDPELSNITIATFGAGMKVNKQTSIDLVYHGYAQVEVDDNLRGSDLEFDPLGLNDDLGDELDLIVGYDDGEALEIQAVAGLLQPGSAFAADSDDAWLVRLEVEYTFLPLER